METKIKELIAIGASVTANCVPCLRFHLQQGKMGRGSQCPFEWKARGGARRKPTELRRHLTT
jgi:AhpD family alkylhydroperoxidase